MRRMSRKSLCQCSSIIDSGKSTRSFKMSNLISIIFTAKRKTMSRSVRKTKKFGITAAETEKQDKRRWNRVFRKVSRDLIRLEKEAPIKVRGVTNVWDGAKDGKRYYQQATKKDMRK